MAGPSIVVRVLGDLQKFQSAFTASSKTAESAAGRIHGAFSSMLGTLNASGVLGPFGESLAHVNDAMDSINEKGKSVGKTMLAVGGAGVGVGLGLTALGSKDQAAHAQLQAAVEATGKSYDDYEGKVESAIKTQEKFGDTASTTQDALRVLTQATNDPAKALQLLSTATDLAAAKHESLGEAATQLGKAYNGSSKILKEFGLTALPTAAKAQTALTKAQTAASKADVVALAAKVKLSNLEKIDAGRRKLTLAQTLALKAAQDKVNVTSKAAVLAHQKLAQAQDAAKKSAGNQMTTMDQLSNKLKGQASAAANTFTGHVDALKAKVEDAAASFGQHYGPAITTAAGITAGLGGAWETAAGIAKTFKKTTDDVKKAQDGVKAAQEGVKAATVASTAATDAATVSEGLALGPILLIVAAVAALIAIGYVIYRNWGTIWGGIKAIIQDVWHWIKANWPLLLAIILGPIAVAALEIERHWGDIKAAAVAVWNWLAHVWGDVYGFLTGPISSAIGWIGRAWASVTGFFSGVAGAISRVWSGVYGTLTGAISSAISWIGQAWAGVTGFFSGVAGGIARTWSAVTGYITGPLAAAETWISGWVGRIVGFFQGLPGKVLSAISGLGGQIVSAITSHIPGGGIVGKAISAIGGVFQEGGYVPGSGPQLAILHGGEYVLSQRHLAALTQPGGHSATALAPVRSGPAVNVEKAYFSSELDVETFMRKAAWVVRTQRV